MPKNNFLHPDFFSFMDFSMQWNVVRYLGLLVFSLFNSENAGIVCKASSIIFILFCSFSRRFVITSVLKIARPLLVRLYLAPLLNIFSSTKPFFKRKSSRWRRAMQSILQAYAIASADKDLSARAIKISSYSSSFDLRILIRSDLSFSYCR